MPKLQTFPTLFDEVLQINITKLKNWGYLNPEQIKNGTITWSGNGSQTGCISIRVNTQSGQPYIELDYKYGDEPRNYNVSLVSMPSNLGKGLIWYLLCPQTNKRGRNLYLVGGCFLHREAFNGCMYESQTQSKQYRQLHKSFGAYFKTDALHGKLYKKHFKKTYEGKPTKRYLRIMKQIQKAENISFRDIERLMIN